MAPGPIKLQAPIVMACLQPRANPDFGHAGGSNMLRFCLAVAIAVVLSGCVVPERRRSISDVRESRIADVLVEFPA